MVGEKFQQIILQLWVMIRQMPKILKKINLSGFFLFQQYSLYHQGESMVKQTPAPVSNSTQNKNMIAMQAQYKKINQQGFRHAELTRKIRSACSIYEIKKILVENFDQFQQLGKTLIFDYLNLASLQIRGSRSKTLLQELVKQLARLQNLSLYQLTMKLSVYQKLRVFLLNSSKDQFAEDLYKCVDQILIKLQEMQSDISVYDFINILGSFRIQSHPKLLSKSLEILDKEIFKSDISDLKYKKLWIILLNQFKYFTWNDLKKYNNIIKFWTDQFSLAEINWTYQEACQLFIKLTDLKLHKIGQKKIPQAIKQCMVIISQNVKKLPLRNLITVLKQTALLPAEFVSDFRQILMKRFIENGQFFTSGILFPFVALNSHQFEQFFSPKFTQIEQVWRSMAFYSQLQELNVIMRGNLKEQIGKIIDKIQGNKNQKADINSIYSVECGTNLVRVGHLAIFYTSKKEEQKLKQLGNIIISGFNKIGFKKALKQVSFMIFFDMFLIFHDNPIIHDLFKEFCTILNLRKQRSKYDNFIRNCWKTIKNFIQFENEYIQKGILVMVDELYNARQIQLSSEQSPSSQNKNAFDWATDVYFLYYIMSRKEQPNPPLKQLKAKIISKIKTFQELETIVEYFILESSNLNFRASVQLVNLILKLSNLKSTNEKGKQSRVLFILLNLMQSSNSMVNKRGKLQSNLVNYLNNFDGKIYDQIMCFQYLNLLNRTLNSIKQFGQVKKFVLKIYRQTLIQIHEKMQKQQNLKKSSRLIVQFLFKIQSIMDSKSIVLSENRVLLEKIYVILKKLIKIDDGIFIKAKLYEFITMYREFIDMKENISEALVLELEYELSKCGENTNSLKQTYFTLCKLECMGLHELSSVVEYSSILLQLVKKQKVTAFSMNNFILSILYSIELLNLKQNKTVIQKFNSYITPMVSRSIPICTGLNNPYIIFNCIKYFIFVKNEQKVQFLTYYLLKLYLSPKILLNLLQHLNWRTMSKPLLDAILNKTLNVMYLFDSNSINLLYMFERVYFNTPAEYSKIRQTFWLTANQQMDKNITNLKKKKQKLTFEEKRKLLGPFILYIFCCIKAERVEGNKNIQFLLPFIAENSSKIYSGDSSMQYSLSKYIILYAYNADNADNAGKADKADKPKLFKSGKSQVKIELYHEKSKQLEIFLAENSILFSKNEKINNIRVPYYLPRQKQVIILNSHNYTKDQLMNKKMTIHGHMKFQYEVYKALLPGYKVKIFDPCTSILI